MNLLVAFVILLLSAVCLAAETPYRLGLSIKDITGPAAEVNMMGYAMLNQRTHGIHLRLRSRVFIVEHKESKKKVVYVNNDIGMCMQSVKETVIEQLHKLNSYTVYFR